MREGGRFEETFLEEVIPSGTHGTAHHPPGQAEEAERVFLAAGTAWSWSAVSRDPSQELKVQPGLELGAEVGELKDDPVDIKQGSV